MVESLGSFIHGIILSANKAIFTSSFTTWISFISPSCLPVLAKTSSSDLNRSGRSGCLCLVPDFGGNTLCFSFKDDLDCGLTVHCLCYIDIFPTSS